MEDQELVALLDRKFAVIDEKFAVVNEQFAGVNEKFAAISEQFAGVNEQFAVVNEQFAGVNEKFAEVRSELRELKINSERIEQELQAVRSTTRLHEISIQRVKDEITLPTRGVAQRLLGLESRLVAKIETESRETRILIEHSHHKIALAGEDVDGVRNKLNGAQGLPAPPPTL